MFTGALFQSEPLLLLSIILFHNLHRGGRNLLLRLQRVAHTILSTRMILHTREIDDKLHRRQARFPMRDANFREVGDGSLVDRTTSIEMSPMSPTEG